MEENGITVNKENNNDNILKDNNFYEKNTVDISSLQNEIYSTIDEDRLNYSEEKKIIEEKKIQKLQEEDKKYSRLEKLEGSMNFNDSLRTSFEKFNLVTQSFSTIKNHFSDSTSWIDPEFVNNNGWDKILKEDKYSILNEEMKNELIANTGKNEWIFRRRADEMVGIQERTDVYNGKSIIQQAPTLITGVMTDPSQIFASIKIANSANKIFNVTKSSSLLKRTSVAGVSTGITEGIIEKQISDNDLTLTDEERFNNTLIASVFGGVAGSLFNKVGVLDDVIKSEEKIKVQYNEQVIKYSNEERLLDNSNEAVNKIRDNKFVDDIRDDKGLIDIKNREEYKPVFTKIRFDDYNSMYKKGKDNKIYNSILNYMFKDPVGIGKNKGMQHKTYSEILGNKQNEFQSKLGIGYNNLEMKLKKEPINYKELGSKDLDTYMTTLMRDLEDGIKTIEEIPKPIKEYFDFYRKELDDMIDEYAVEGVNIERNNNGWYVQRRADKMKFKNIRKEIGDKNLKKIIKESILDEWKKFKTKEELKSVNKVLNEVVDAYHKRFMADTSNIGISDISTIKRDISDIVEDLKYENKINEEELNNFKKILDKKSIDGPSQSKKRIKMNVRKKVKVKKENGEEIEYSVEDWLVNDFTKLFNSMKRNSITDLTKRQKAKLKIDNKIYDLTSKLGINNAMEAIKKSEEYKIINTDKLERMLNHLNEGAILEKQSRFGDSGNAVARIFRNSNVFTSMGQSFIAQMSEMVMVIGSDGIFRSIKNIPEMNGLSSRIKNNKLTQDDINFMEDYGNYTMVDSFKMKSGNRLEDDFLNPDSEIQFINLIDKTMEGAADFTITHLGQLRRTTKFSRHLSIMNEIDKFYTRFLKNETLGEGRLAELRLTKQDEIDINTMFNSLNLDKKPSVTKLLKELDNNGFRDTTLYNKFKDAAILKSQNRVIEKFIGEGVEILEDNILGKMSSQFLSFTLSSYSKLLLKNLAHMDSETISLFISGMAGAALTTMIKNYGNYGNDEKKLEMKMDPKVMAMDIFSNNPNFALPGTLMAIILGITGEGKEYNIRSSSTSSVLTSNPTTSKLDRLSNLALKGAKMDMSASDISTVTPNVLGLKMILHELDKELDMKKSNY